MHHVDSNGKEPASDQRRTGVPVTGGDERTRPEIKQRPGKKSHTECQINTSLHLHEEICIVKIVIFNCSYI